MCPTQTSARPPHTTGDRTRKHKVKCNDTIEATQEQVYESITPTKEPSKPPKHHQPKQFGRKAHLLTALASLSLAQNASSLHTLDSGEILTKLGESNLREHDPFDPTSAIVIFWVAI